MTSRVQVTFHGIEHSDGVEELVRERSKKLEALHGELSGCRVTLEAPHRHHQHGNNFRVRIDLRLPGEELVVGRSRDKGDEHADLYVAVNDAFDGAARQLSDFISRRRSTQRRPHGSSS